MSGCNFMFIFILLQLKLEKQAQDLRKSGEPFNALVKRFDLWLDVNKKRILEFFRCIDSTKEGYVTYDEFKSGRLVWFCIL